MYTADDFRKSFEGRKTGIQGAKGHFSVLVPVTDIGGRAHILYELRSGIVDRQPNEVCFPGGEMENGETPEQTVLRETMEEIGIMPEDVDIIAQLDIYHPASGIVIYPFLGEIKQQALSGLKLAPKEVGEVFLVPVSWLCENEPYRYSHFLNQELGDDFDYGKIGLSQRRYDWRPVKSEIISWNFEDKYIWGLTAQITEHTLKILEGKIR